MTSSCSAKLLIPKLQNRTLRIHLLKPALYYDYKVCKEKKILGIVYKKECKWVTDVYDLTKKEVRQTLRNMGFQAKSKLRWK